MVRVTLLLSAEQREWLETCVGDGQSTGGISAVVRALLDGVSRSGVDLPATEANQRKRIMRLLWWGDLVERSARQKRPHDVRAWLGKIRRAHLALEETLTRPDITPPVVAHAGSVDLAEVETLRSPLVLSPPSDALLEKIARGCEAVAASETRHRPERADAAESREGLPPPAIVPEATFAKLRTCLVRARTLGFSSEKIATETRIEDTTLAAFERGEALGLEQTTALVRWLVVAGIAPSAR